MTIETHIILVVVLVIASAYFSAAETALFSLSRLDIERLKESSRPFAARLLGLLAQPRRVLATLIFGNELTNVAISVFFGSLIYEKLNYLGWQWALVISAAITTPIILIFGEILPKNLAMGNAPVLAPILAVPLRWFGWLVAPFQFFLTGIADWFVRRFGGDPERAAPLIMEEEFRRLVDLGVVGGEIDRTEHDLIDRVFAFGDTRVEEWCTPLDSITSVSLKMSFDEVIAAVRESGYSRVPVCDENPRDIVGMVYSRDLLMAYQQRKLGRVVELEEMVRPVLFLGHSIRVEEALRDFQKSKIHLAVVTDDTQNAIGILTMDELLDRLFGIKVKR